MSPRKNIIDLYILEGEFKGRNTKKILVCYTLAYGKTYYSNLTSKLINQA